MSLQYCTYTSYIMFILVRYYTSARSALTMKILLCEIASVPIVGSSTCLKLPYIIHSAFVLVSLMLSVIYESRVEDSELLCNQYSSISTCFGSGIYFNFVTIDGSSYFIWLNAVELYKIWYQSMGPSIRST